MNVQLKVFMGPNRYHHSRCILFTVSGIDSPGKLTLNKQNLRLLDQLLRQQNLPEFNLEECALNPAGFMAELSMSCQSVQFDLGLHHRSIGADAGSERAVAEFYCVEAAHVAAAFSVQAFNFLVSKDASGQQALEAALGKVIDSQRKRQPAQATLAMLSSARKLNIPFYMLLNNTELTCYGQGCHGLLFQRSGNEFDSAIGMQLQQNKIFTNFLLKRLGFPSTQQSVATNLAHGLRLFKELGSRVVVKPAAQGMGLGVSSNVISEDEFKDAFRRASGFSGPGVLVEKHEEGFDHRITVSDGKVIGAICRMPARVFGDGNSSIASLIEQENRNRPESKKRLGLVKDIVVDANLEAVIAKEGLTLQSVPEAGRQVLLRSNANISTGGIFEDVIHIMHPDNFQMAIDVARAFRINIMGLDFMTRDISRSWKEQGVIIEINTTPGILEELAHAQLVEKFQSRNWGRIPCILMLDLEPAQRSRILENYSQYEYGLVDNGEVKFRDRSRGKQLKSVYDKAFVLLTDPHCEAICIACSASDVQETGLPVDKFDVIYLNKALAAQVDQGGQSKYGWLSNYCDELTAC